MEGVSSWHPPLLHECSRDLNPRTLITFVNDRYLIIISINDMTTLMKATTRGQMKRILSIHAFNSSCEALGNSAFNCYRALWAGMDRYGVPAFLSFSLFLERTRTFYSILGLFKVYLEFLQHTGSILELFTAYSTSHESVVTSPVQFLSAICD